MLRLTIIGSMLLSATAAAAVPTEHNPPAFPASIHAVHPTPTGAYLLSGRNDVWFVEPNGNAREVPIPVDDQIEHLDYEPSGGLLWGCTRTTVFATSAAGAWQSWGLPGDDARGDCRVAVSPGGVTWVVSTTATADDVFTEITLASGSELTLESQRYAGAQFRQVATDGAGGFWAIPNYPLRGLAHFDGASWRIWSPDRFAWAGTDFHDIFAFDRDLRPQHLASDGTGGVIAATVFEFAFVRSTAPYPNIVRRRVATPGFGLQSDSLTVGPRRIWGVGTSDDSLVLASWDFSGRFVGAEPVPQPKWFRRDLSYGKLLVAADAHGQWIAAGGVLFHRHAGGWGVFAAHATVERLKRRRREKAATFYTTVPFVGAAAVMSLSAPGIWAPRLGVAYPRALGETLAGTAIGTIGAWAMVANGVWDGGLMTAIQLTWGCIFTTGLATVATVTPEAVFTEDGEPFPVGGAVLGGLIGFGAGALFDLVLDKVAGVNTELGRSALWASFIGVGAPLGFHALRGPLGAD